MSVSKISIDNTKNHVDIIVQHYYDAIKFVKNAQDAIERKDYEASHNLIENAYQIINLMHKNLKVDCNEQLSIALNDHYEAIEFQLDGVQSSNSLDLCSEIIEDLDSIKESWELISLKRANLVAQIAAGNENKPSNNVNYLN